jgi:zinc/manganese transport system substrate-binding protein
MRDLLAAPRCSFPSSACDSMSRLEPEWRRSRRSSARQGDVVSPTHRAPGSASISSAAEPDRARCAARPAGVLGPELEVGWLPLLLTQSGNAQCSRAGRATSRLALRAKLEVPTSVDRSHGRRASRGNPHCISIRATSRRWPRRWRLARRSSRPTPRTTSARDASASVGRRRSRAGEKQAAPLKGVPVVVYTRTSLLRQLARPARGRQPRAQARHPAVAPHTRRLVGAEAQARAADVYSGVQRSARGAIPFASAPASPA